MSEAYGIVFNRHYRPVATWLWVYHVKIQYIFLFHFRQYQRSVLYFYFCKKCIKWTHNGKSCSAWCSCQATWSVLIKYDIMGLRQQFLGKFHFVHCDSNCKWNGILLFLQIYLPLQEPEACNKIHRMRLDLATTSYSLLLLLLLTSSSLSSSSYRHHPYHVLTIGIW
jgi:hypothetical protein